VESSGESRVFKDSEAISTVATSEEEALMAPESLRTIESPETSNVLAAEGSPERRKRKQLVGRAVGRIPPRSGLKLLQREEEDMKICSLDEYEIFDDDEEVASLLDLPLHYKKHTLGRVHHSKRVVCHGEGGQFGTILFFGALFVGV
jgi:hypothetical protein